MPVSRIALSLIVLPLSAGPPAASSMARDTSVRVIPIAAA
jgi:hypothetical protein